MGVPNPKTAATASGLAELGGGLALAAGLFTRPLSLCLTGPGRLSVDYLMSK